MDDPFPTLYEGFLRAAEADPDLRKESFLEKARHHIAKGILRASGRRFSETFGGLLILGADVDGTEIVLDDTEIVPRKNKTESPDHVEISPLSMVDYRLIFVDGPKVDCQVVRETGEYGDLDGWKDVRAAAGDLERLWPRAAPSPDGTAPSRASYRAGDRAKILLNECFNGKIPLATEMSNSDLVRRVQAQHCKDALKGEPPSRETILIHAGRSKRR